MDLIADILLGAGAIGAALYCIVLSRRLRHFADLENGVGGAIAALSDQVDGMNTALERARASAQKVGGSLEGLTERAEHAAGRLELLVATMHDLPDPDARNASDDNRTETVSARAGHDAQPPEAVSEVPAQDVLFTTGRVMPEGLRQ